MAASTHFMSHQNTSGCLISFYITRKKKRSNFVLIMQGWESSLGSGSTYEPHPVVWSAKIHLLPWQKVWSTLKVTSCKNVALALKKLDLLAPGANTDLIFQLKIPEFRLHTLSVWVCRLKNPETFGNLWHLPPPNQAPDYSPKNSRKSISIESEISSQEDINRLSVSLWVDWYLPGN